MADPYSETEVDSLGATAVGPTSGGGNRSKAHQQTEVDPHSDTRLGAPNVGDPNSELVDTAELEAAPDSNEWDGLSKLARAPAMRPMLGRGTLVGRYVVLSKLGAGGMGVVYAVHDPELDRKVALKLLHPRVETNAATESEARTRLVREAQALAKLNHPNIVAVHDVGEHEGAVWLAMAFVDGETLGAWMKARRRSWREVLDALMPAARGLAAAHGAGLVHRDIKPDNIMLGTDGRVRVMDLGLARTLGGDLGASIEAETVGAGELDGLASGETAVPNGLAGWVSGETVGGGLAARVTRTGAVLGTPAYMSPEQYCGRVADARTDVFSLCVTMWEALFGERPFTGETLMELAANVATGTIRPVPKDALSKRVPGWLRRVCLQGLAVEPDARFGSMQELLAAIARGRGRARVGRWLMGVAAVAALGASGVAYQAYDRGQRVAACEADGATVTKVWNEDARAAVRAGLLATGVSHAEVTAAKVMPWIDDAAEAWKDARTGACLARRVERAWSEETLDRAVWCLDERRDELDALVAELSQAKDETVHKAVTAAAGLSSSAVCTDPSVLGALPEPPPAESRAQVADLRRELSRAGTLSAAAQYDEGLRVTRAALEQAEALGWPPLTAAARRVEGTILERKGEYTEAEAASLAAYMEAAKMRVWEVAAAAATDLIFTIGDHQARHGDGKVWAGHAEVAVSMLGDPLHLREASWLNNLGAVHRVGGEYAEARAVFERALAIREKALGPDHPDVADSLHNLGDVHRLIGDYAAATTVFEQVLAIREKALGPDHPSVADSLSVLGTVRRLLGDQTEVREVFERALAIREKALGPDHSSVADSLDDIGNLHHDIGESVEARVLYERSLAIREKALGLHHPDVARSLNHLAVVHEAMGEYPETRELCTRALAIWEKVLGPEHPDVAVALINLGVIHVKMGEYPEAKARFERALDLGDKGLGPYHPRVGVTLNNLGEVHRVLGEYAKARERFERALTIWEKLRDPDHPDVAVVLTWIGEVALEQEQPQEALESLERAVGIFDAHEGVQEGEATGRLALARTLVATGGDTQRARSQVSQAAEAYREAGDNEGLANAEAFLKEHGAEK